MWLHRSSADTACPSPERHVGRGGERRGDGCHKRVRAGAGPSGPRRSRGLAHSPCLARHGGWPVFLARHRAAERRLGRDRRRRRLYGRLRRRRPQAAAAGAGADRLGHNLASQSTFSHPPALRPHGGCSQPPAVRLLCRSRCSWPVAVADPRAGTAGADGAGVRAAGASGTESADGERGEPDAGHARLRGTIWSRPSPPTSTTACATTASGRPRRCSRCTTSSCPTFRAFARPTRRRVPTWPPSWCSRTIGCGCRRSW